MSTATLRTRAGEWIESGPVQGFIITLIVINAIILGLQTSTEMMAQAGELLLRADQLILAVFVIEILIKLYAQGGGFFRRAWNNFDFIVVGIALVPASGPLAVLRALRILRVLRMIS
ncbi:MAG TPA: ion transporter, partial [Gammaproteobacteria bacterium]